MRIIAAIDDSTHASSVLDELLSREWGPDTEIFIVTVIPERSKEPFLNQHQDYKLMRRLEHEERKKSAASMISEAVDRVRLALPHASIEGLVVSGKPSIAIIDKAIELASDLIIAGSHGKGMVSRLVLGSVSQQLLLHAPCSVAIVREAKRKERDVLNVLLPFDFSEESGRALEQLLSYKWNHDVHFRLLTVVSAPTALVGFEMSSVAIMSIVEECEEAKRRAETFLSEKGALVQERFPSASVSTLVVEGNPKSEICRIADEWPADLVVMGALGQTGFKKALIGSVSQAVVFNSRATVEIVRSRTDKNGKIVACSKERQTARAGG